MTRLIAFMLLVLVGSSAALAQRIESEPIERSLPDEELLELLEELELPEIRAAYDRLNRESIGQASRERLAELQRSLAELQATEVRSGRFQAHAESIRTMQQEIRAVLAALLAEPMPARERLELLTLGAETNLTMLHGPEALLLSAAAGMPTEEQRGEIVSLASQARACAEEALVLLDEVLYELEDELTQSGDAVARQERRRLIEDWRDARLPLLSALAGSAEALAKGDETLATEALASFDLLDTGDLSTSARLGLAQAQLSAGRSGEAERYFLELLEAEAPLRVNEQLAATFGLAGSRAASSRASDGHAVLDDLERAPLFQEQVPTLWRVLLADCRFRLDLAQAQSVNAEASRRALLSAAARHYQQLIGAAGDLRLREEVLQDLVLSKLSTCVDLEDIESEALPSLVLLARAQANLENASTLAQGMALLAAATERDELDYDLAGRLFIETAPLRETELTRDVRTSLLRLATDLAESQSRPERALRVLSTGKAYAWRIARDGSAYDPPAYEALLKARLAFSDSPYYSGSDNVSLAELYLANDRIDEAVALLLPLDTRGYWGVMASGQLTRARQLQWDEARGTPEERMAAELLLEAARRQKEAASIYIRNEEVYQQPVLHQGAEASTVVAEVDALISLGRLEEALETLEVVSLDDYVLPEWRIWHLRNRAEILSQMGRTSEAAAAVQELIATFSSDAGQEVIALLERLIKAEEVRRMPGADAPARAYDTLRDLLQLTREVITWARDHDVENLPAHQLRLARMLVFAGEAEESLTLLDSLARADETITRQARYLLTRADACFLLDQDAEAFQLCSTLIQALSAQSEHNSTFWAATLRRLLILERQGRLDQIRPRLQRLRELDADLGGEPFRSELQALQLRLVGEGG